MSKQKSKESTSPFQDLLTRSTQDARKKFSQYGRALFVQPKSASSASEFEAFVQTLTRSCFVEVRSLLLATRTFKMTVEQMQMLRQLILHSVLTEVVKTEGAPWEDLAEMTGLGLAETSPEAPPVRPLRTVVVGNDLSAWVH